VEVVVEVVAQVMDEAPVDELKEDEV